MTSTHVQNTPLLIAQLSDAHTGTGPGFLDGRVDAAAALRRAVLHVAPSVAHQIALDLRSDAPLCARLEPPKVSLHRWVPGLGLCTHLSYVEPFGEPLPL